MNTKNLPAIVMLLAGLVASIVMFRMRYDLNTMLKIILQVFFAFYILGMIVKRLLDKFCVVKKEEDENQDGQEAKEQEEKGEEEQSQDGAVIEKKDAS